MIVSNKKKPIKYLFFTIIFSQDNTKKIIQIGMVSIINLYPKDHPPHHIVHLATKINVKSKETNKYFIKVSSFFLNIFGKYNKLNKKIGLNTKSPLAGLIKIPAKLVNKGVLKNSIPFLACPKAQIDP